MQGLGSCLCLPEVRLSPLSTTATASTTTTTNSSGLSSLLIIFRHNLVDQLTHIICNCINLKVLKKRRFSKLLQKAMVGCKETNSGGKDEISNSCQLTFQADFRVHAMRQRKWQVAANNFCVQKSLLIWRPSKLTASRHEFTINQCNQHKFADI